MRTPLPKLLAHPGTLSTFPRKLPTLLGKRGGGLPSGTAPALPTGFQLPKRRVRTHDASHPEGASTPTARPRPGNVRHPAKEALQKFALILYFHLVVEIVTIKWRVTFPESSWLRNRAPLRSR